MIFWLVMVISGAPLHVGNFPDAKSCAAAAKTASERAFELSGRAFGGGFVCVQANVPNGPPAPPG